jgi:tetratricopeptide (TPR) repeat protein
MKYKGANKSSSEIAADLGISYIIEGSVVKANDLVKITTRLIDAATDEYLWAQEYERNFTDILSLQGDVARAIAKQIKVKLAPSEETLLTGKRTVNPEAYEAYLKGNFYCYKLTQKALETSLQYYELAVKLDPDYAPAYAGIAFVWGGRAQMGYIPMHVASEKAKPAAAKALELDTSLAEIHYMNAVFYGWSEWKWDLAVKSFENAIRLNPNMAEARAYYSHILFILNRPETAMLHIERALELDPFSALFQALYAMDLIYIHSYDEAIKLLQNTLKNVPGDPITLSTLRTAYHQKKMYKEALEIWRLSFAARGDQQCIEALNRGNEEGGYSMALRRVAETKIEQSKTKYISPWPIATLYTRAGMPEEALQWFEKALIARDPNMPYLNVDPIFDYLRDDPRFKNLIREIGLTVSEKK